MRIHRTVIVCAAAAALALPALAGAQSSTRPEASKANAKGALSDTERKFVTEAARGGMAEIELGKLAGERASNDTVKQFGQRMATDHAKANDELKDLAQQKGLSVPSQLDPKHKQLVDRLSKLSGPAFDKAYIDEMVKDHGKDVAEFRRESRLARDPDLKAWAAKTLPTLEDHYKQVQQVQSQLKGRAAR